MTSTGFFLKINAKHFEMQINEITTSLKNIFQKPFLPLHI